MHLKVVATTYLDGYNHLKFTDFFFIFRQAKQVYVVLTNSFCPLFSRRALKELREMKERMQIGGHMLGG